MEVTLIAYTPNPDQVCDMAARTCTSSECPELSTAVNRTKALQHALSSGHESVAEHAVFSFQVEGISRACSHQLVRHRLASYSQQSQRYVNARNFGYVTPDSILACEQEVYSTDAQMDVQLSHAYDDVMREIRNLYCTMLNLGVPEEDARYILPNACCTNITVTMNARELRHFFGERLCTRAQWEIREMSEKMLELVKEVAPVLFDGVGAKCEKLGYCPEAKGCGRYPDLRGLGEEYWIGHWHESKIAKEGKTR